MTQRDRGYWTRCRRCGRDDFTSVSGRTLHLKRCRVGDRVRFDEVRKGEWVELRVGDLRPLYGHIDRTVVLRITKLLVSDNWFYFQYASGRVGHRNRWAYHANREAMVTIVKPPTRYPPGTVPDNDRRSLP